MRTAKAQSYLLDLGHLYIDDSIELIRKSTLDSIDKIDCIEVLHSGDFERYRFLDTIVRDKLMDILAKQFCYIDSDTYIKLSEIVIKAMSNNNKAIDQLTSPAAITAIEHENKRLQKLNDMLIDYSERFDD